MRIEMNGEQHPGKNSALILLVLATISAAGMARWCMSSGVGVSPDSVIYLSAADSLIAGNGLKPIAFHYSPKIESGKPLISFPPTYPLLLSLSGMLSANRLNGARWLHSFLFAINVLLIGIIVCLSTNRSFLATLCGVLLVLSSSAMLEIHTMAWSEPPFILFLLMAVLFLMLHIRTPHYLLLVGSALSASLAVTTRYAGITILPPLVLTILLHGNKQLKGRIRDCLLLVGIAMFPLALWFIRNILLADSATNRSIAFHPIGMSDIHQLADSMLVFWVPFIGNVYLKVILLLVCGALVLLGVMRAPKDSVRFEKSVNVNSAAQMFAAVFVATYLLFLIVYNSLTDPAVDLGRRVLSPVYMFGIILLISAAYELSSFGNRTTLWRGFLVVSFALVSVNAVGAFSSAVHRHDNGSGYTSREWFGSESIEYVRTLSEAKTTYSNGVDAIYLLTSKHAVRIPAKVDPTRGKSNVEFDRDISAMRNELMQNRALVVYLDKITWRWYLPSKDELENVYKLPVLVRLEDGVIYGIK